MKFDIKKVKYWYIGIIITSILTLLYNIYFVSSLGTNSWSLYLFSSFETFFILFVACLFYTMVVKKTSWKTDLVISLIVGVFFAIFYIVGYNPYIQSMIFDSRTLIVLAFRTITMFIGLVIGGLIIDRKN